MTMQSDPLDPIQVQQQTSDPLLMSIRDPRGTDTMSSSPGPEGQPPVTYMASLIAQQLLRVGESMFNRRADANCILKVGDDRYFVHVQMLASRSPTFRRIFDEMIAQEAWGKSADADISSEGGASYGQLDEDDELVSYNSDYSYQDSVNMSGEDHGLEWDGDESMRDDNSTTSTSQRLLHRRRRARSASQESALEDPSLLLSAMPNQLGSSDSTSNHRPSAPSPLSLPPEDAGALTIERLNAQVLQLHVRDDSTGQYEMKRGTCNESPGLVSEEKQDEGRSDEAAEISDGEDVRSTNSNGTDGLPELSVTFVDPKGTHFKELLYWNILHLNIVTSAVLELCMVFEATTAPELGLRGMALSVLCGSSASSPGASTIPSSNAETTISSSTATETDTGPT
ncbi:hypothetical protein BGZ95_007936 [Linnemannia exigua]|uniref:BTB domain-containing protein n=1 Tax=Linnemannia exigua TaxID=604196 RepID=A0AAD4HBU0_9FUNG|nr:hypothetical protein BGZ95_007936 [Linnemannia exigua]